MKGVFQITLSESNIKDGVLTLPRPFKDSKEFVDTYHTVEIETEKRIISSPAGAFVFFDTDEKDIKIPLNVVVHRFKDAYIDKIRGYVGWSWSLKLYDEFQQEYMKKLNTILKQEYARTIVYPKYEDIFNALRLTAFEHTDVVIIGQDPYPHHAAHGLAFSSGTSSFFPASLQNILKEVKEDVYSEDPNFKPCANLSYWASQGVLLLNTVLSVERGKPFSHSSIGWQRFTAKIVNLLYEDKRPKVFMLWGKKAEEFFYPATGKNDSVHLILKAPHPSPLSAYTGFFGCKHFSKANQFLTDHKRPTVKW